MDQPDAVVIGAGTVGLSCACALAEAGLRILVLERHRPGAGASWANAGWVVPSHSVPLAEPGVVRRGLRWLVHPESPVYVPLRADRFLWSWLWRFLRSSTNSHVRRALPLLVRLQLRSFKLYERLAVEEPDFGWCQAGSFTVFADRRQLEEACEEVRWLRQEGIRAEVLDAHGVREREPLLRGDLVGGVYFPGDAHLDPAALVEVLARRAARLGVEVRTGQAARLRRRGRMVLVQADAAELQPPAVVVAAGAWSGLLLRQAGFSLPLVPAKGYSVTVTDAQLPSSPLMLSEARVAVTPLPGGRLRLAGTLELGVWSLRPNPRRVAAIRRAAARYLTVGPEGGEVWAGLRPCTPDGLPAVGRPSVADNLVVATGHGTFGISLAAVTGELVAGAVVGPAPEDLLPLSPDRFT
ncbi:MAG: FAD-dependent oxidoreductase [candidate division GAL15 bacterium]